jgi:hypothetical protein
MSNITINKEDKKILKLGLNYTFEKPVKHFLQDLIIDTENTIKHLDAKEQNIYRFLACKKLKQIQNTNIHSTLHKRQLFITKQIRTKLAQNNLITKKADKGKTIVIMNKKNLHAKSRFPKREPFYTNT